MKIVKKILLFIIVCSMLLLLTACSSDKKQLKNYDKTEIGVDEGLLTVEITIPSEFLEGQTQEDLDIIAKENGYEAIILNSNGSATYKMTKSQHKKMLKEMADSLNKSFDEMIGSEDYPNFTEIKVNDNFTDFTIKTKSAELDLNESISVMTFYLCGGMYNIYSGDKVDNVHVKFINDLTGEVISESNSSDMAEAAEE